MNQPCLRVIKWCLEQLQHYSARKTHNIFELLIQTSWCLNNVFSFFFSPAVWVQLMKTLTVSPTQASESAACWLRDPLAEEPSIKRRITPTLTPRTTAALPCLSSCWLGASDRDPCSCPGRLTWGAQREKGDGWKFNPCAATVPIWVQFTVIC